MELHRAGVPGCIRIIDDRAIGHEEADDVGELLGVAEVDGVRRTFDSSRAPRESLSVLAAISQARRTAAASADRGSPTTIRVGMRSPEQALERRVAESGSRTSARCWGCRSAGSRARPPASNCFGSRIPVTSDLAHGADQRLVVLAYPRATRAPLGRSVWDRRYANSLMTGQPMGCRRALPDSIPRSSRNLDRGVSEVGDVEHVPGALPAACRIRADRARTCGTRRASRSAVGSRYRPERPNPWMCAMTRGARPAWLRVTSR